MKQWYIETTERTVTRPTTAPSTNDRMWSGDTLFSNCHVEWFKHNMHVNHTYLSQGIINSMKDIIARQSCHAQSQTIIKLPHSSIIGHQCAPMHYRNRSRLIAEEHMAKIADVFNGVSLAISDLKHFYWPDDVTNSRKSWSANECITWLIRHG